MDKQEILNFLQDNKKMFKMKYNVSKLGLFGSYATSQQTENSDIDIIVSMPSNFDNYYDLKEFLELHFQKKVDLGFEKNLRKVIRDQIKDEIIYV